ncbi:MAG: glycosyltransferase [Rhodobacteraceae bacterium]|nr:glycosyltransferase [Paracoccaceae bacterium]
MFSTKIDNSTQRNPKLGDVLVDRGNISKSDLMTALKMQSTRDAMLGEIIVANRLAKQADVDDALNLQFDGAVLDVSCGSPDPDLLLGVDPWTCLKRNMLPWRKMDGQVIVAAEDPKCPKTMLAVKIHWPDATILHADAKDLRHCIQTSFRDDLTRTASTLCPEKNSCREIGKRLSGIYGVMAVTLIAAIIIFAPMFGFFAIFFWALASNIATTILRASALVSFFFSKSKTIKELTDTPRLSDFRKRPKVTVLLPLFREDKVLKSLLTSLNRITYPKELLEVKILLEEEDQITAKALAKCHLPRWADIITIPKDTLQTKPRAMNYALPFCKGEIIGIYDAEDRPEPDQIDKVVCHLMTAPTDVGSVQCYLDYYNSSSNWMSRCFTIEYASWFRVIMRGLQKIGAPLPLGGTSVFVRRNVLEEVGAWDAHNVTEDADLGMRMARFGYRCEVVDSTTWEEANNHPIAWIKQRSRWLKGFAMTWATHMRNPLQLWRDLGPVGFFGFQAVLLGTVTAYLTAPVFWVIWTGYMGVDWAFFEVLPAWFWSATFIALIAGEAVMITIAIVAMLLKRRLGLIPFIFTLSLYWPLGTIAAFKALWELFFAPFYWDKTDHGND